MRIHAFRVRRGLATAAATILAGAPASTVRAQLPVVGEWLIHDERIVRSMHDATPHTVVENVRMTLRLRGDSVFGYWLPQSEPGDAPSAPGAVRGTIRGDTARVQLDLAPPVDETFFAEMGREIVQFLKTYVHNMPPMTTHLEFVARGDSLVGTRRGISADGAKQSSPRSFVALRAGNP